MIPDPRRLNLRTAAALTCVFTVWLGVGFAAAQPQQPAGPLAEPDQFFRGTVVAVLAEREEDLLGGQAQLVQTVRVRLATGAADGEIQAEFSDLPGDPGRRLRPGDAVVVALTDMAGQPAYFVVDRFRLPPIGAIFLLFFGLAAVLSRIRGVMSVAGLGVTAIVLVKFVVPQIQAGTSPMMVSLVGALVIALSSIYLAHGFSARTTVALAGTLLTLLISAALAAAFVSLARLFGTGTEEALFLRAGVMETVNLRGLLLGGIILGALGVLDDITTSQAAAVDEIRRANPELSTVELYRRGWPWAPSTSRRWSTRCSSPMRARRCPCSCSSA